MLRLMNVSLTPELEKFICDKVRTGKYQTASEVVREALRTLMDREQLRAVELRRLHSELAVGLDQVSRSRTLDITKIKSAARKRMSSRGIKRVG
jgi:antitoxin ParD1/3/4